MDIGPPERTIAQRRSVVGTSHRRVWALLGVVTFQQLPLEKVAILGLDRFNAVLNVI